MSSRRNDNNNPRSTQSRYDERMMAQMYRELEAEAAGRAAASTYTPSWSRAARAPAPSLDEFDAYVRTSDAGAGGGERRGSVPASFTERPAPARARSTAGRGGGGYDPAATRASYRDTSNAEPERLSRRSGGGGGDPAPQQSWSSRRRSASVEPTGRRSSTDTLEPIPGGGRYSPTTGEYRYRYDWGSWVRTGSDGSNDEDMSDGDDDGSAGSSGRAASASQGPAPSSQRSVSTTRIPASGRDTIVSWSVIEQPRLRTPPPSTRRDPSRRRG